MSPAVTRAIGIMLLIPCFVAVYDGVIVFTSWQRLGRAAGTVADRVAREDGSAETDFAPYFAEAQALAQPDDVSRRGAVIISALHSGAGGGMVDWQRRNGGLPEPSRYGVEGEAPLPGTAAPGALIGTELLAPLSPWLVGAGWLRAVVPLLHTAVLRPAARG